MLFPAIYIIIRLKRTAFPFAAFCGYNWKKPDSGNARRGDLGRGVARARRAIFLSHSSGLPLSAPEYFDRGAIIHPPFARAHAREVFCTSLLRSIGGVYQFDPPGVCRCEDLSYSDCSVSPSNQSALTLNPLAICAMLKADG